MAAAGATVAPAAAAATSLPSSTASPLGNELWTRLHAQENSLAALRRAVTSCGEEVAVLRDCLRDAGMLSPSHFLARLHRRRFAAARAAHGFAPGARLADILSLKDLALGIGLRAGPRVLRSVAAVSQEIGEMARAVRAAVGEGCPQDIYVFGGGDGSRVLGSVERFSPVPGDHGGGAGSWELLPLAAEPRVSATAAAVAGRLFVCGGWHGQQPSASMERFDPGTGVWEDMPPMFSARGGAASAAIAGRLYVCGGFDVSMQPLASAECFSVAHGTWEELPAMAAPRGSPAAAALRGNLYICGGYDGLFQPQRSSELLVPGALPVGGASNCVAGAGIPGAWTLVADMAEGRAGAAAAAISGRLYVCGGRSGGQSSRSTERFDPEAGTWECLAPMLVGRANAAYAVTGGRLYLFGGRGSGQRLSSCEVFEPRRAEWMPLPAMSERRTDATAVAAC